MRCIVRIKSITRTRVRKQSGGGDKESWEEKGELDAEVLGRLDDAFSLLVC